MYYLTIRGNIVQNRTSIVFFLGTQHGKYASFYLWELLFLDDIHLFTQENQTNLAFSSHQFWNNYLFIHVNPS